MTPMQLYNEDAPTDVQHDFSELRCSGLIFIFIDVCSKAHILFTVPDICGAAFPEVASLDEPGIA